MKEAWKGKDIVKDVIRLITLDNDNSFFYGRCPSIKMNHMYNFSGIHKSN